MWNATNIIYGLIDSIRFDVTLGIFSYLNQVAKLTKAAWPFIYTVLFSGHFSGSQETLQGLGWGWRHRKRSGHVQHEGARRWTWMSFKRLPWILGRSALEGASYLFWSNPYTGNWSTERTHWSPPSSRVAESRITVSCWSPIWCP